MSSIGGSSARRLSNNITTINSNVAPTTNNPPPLMSLVISPNLEALLEYDDRVRESAEGRSLSRPVTPAVQYARRPHQTTPEPSTPIVGLPPPPRWNKGQAKPYQSSASVGLLTAPSGAHVELEDMSFAIPERDDDDDFHNDDRRLSLRHIRTVKNPYINPAPFVPENTHERFSVESPASSSYHVPEQERAWEESAVDISQQGGSDDQGSKALHIRYLNKVEKVLGRKNRSDSPPNRKVFESRSSRHHSLSGSSRSESTCDPSSSPEPHISISSTLYSASSDVRYNQSGGFYSPSSSPNNGSVIHISPNETYSDSQYSISPISSPTSVLAFAPPSAISSKSSNKPPLPTTPKPNFNRPFAIRAAASLSQSTQPGGYRSPQERAELIRKTRKLTQVFGQPPAPSVFAPAHDSFPPPSGESRRMHSRGAISVSNDFISRGLSTSKDEPFLVNSRRHSIPSTPQDFTFSVNAPNSKRESGSFIDLSDDEGGLETQVYRCRQGSSPPRDELSSLFSLTPDEQAEKEKRRKRDKLAKLHRFLGSRVPADLVLGLSFSSGLPAVVSEDEQTEDEKLIFRRRRRRSSSFADYTTTYVGQADRLKSDLDVEEKAVNVWRAAKMEKVFGSAPPQTLYHTRHTYSSPARSDESIPSSPVITVPFVPFVPFVPVINTFKLDYKGKKKTKRPGTSESNQQLLPKNEVNDEYPDDPESKNVYTSYRDSLDSLNDIINRDDRRSLEQLHEFMHSDVANDNDPLILQNLAYQVEATSPASPRVGRRRRSLPSNTLLTTKSGRSVSTPPPEVSSFERRRRRAAKLTSFFGVNHRGIMNEIFDSIEKGVEEEGGNGTLKPDEVFDLLQKLRKLKNKT